MPYPERTKTPEQTKEDKVAHTLSHSGGLSRCPVTGFHGKNPHPHQFLHPIPESHEPLSLSLLTNNKKWNVSQSLLKNRLGQKYDPHTRDCRETFCSAARMDMDYVFTDTSNPEVVLKEAREWIEQYYKEKNLGEEKLAIRLNDVADEIKRTGTYWQTYDEVAYGARVAWRNSPRCINRIQWNRMEVLDYRKAASAEEVFDKLMHHLRFATNRGNIITTISIFPPPEPGKPGVRIWNSQLLRYAAYEQPDGTIIGDPANLELTQAIQRLGWVGEGTMFDILPIVIQMPGERAKVFPIPLEEVLIVQISHPNYDWFGDLSLQWVGVPFVANLGLTCGGIQYTLTPFNGWFMGTEVARDLADPQRYNMLSKIAKGMGLDPNGPPSQLWQEKANLEMNIAVLHSFQRARVSMVDHHTAAAGFLNFWDAEHSAGRPVPADWVWLTPPCAGSVSPLFHLEMVNFLVKPNYCPLEFPGRNYDYGDVKKRNVRLKPTLFVVLVVCGFMRKAHARRHKVTILYATETGNSERFANRTAQFLHRTALARVLCLENYAPKDLENEKNVIFVVSTFGSGDPPANGSGFKEYLRNLPEDAKKKFQGINYAVFGLGSTLYPNFAAFGEYVDKQMAHFGASRITPLVKGDEVAGSELSYKKWMGELWTSLSPLWGFSRAEKIDGLKILGLDHSGAEIKEDFRPKFQLVPANKPSPAETRANTHYDRHNPYAATLKERVELLEGPSEGYRSTCRIVLDLGGGSPVAYRAGDHLGVLPMNNPELVQELLDLLHITNPDEYFTFQPISSDSINEIGSHNLPSHPFTLRQAFTEFLDIVSPPKPELLEIFAQYATDSNLKTVLLELDKTGMDYETWLFYFYPTIPEALRLFSITNIPINVLLEKLPRQQPRFYSISSSPKVFPTEIHLTVSVLKYKTNSGSQHYGVASNYLTRSPLGTKVKAFVRHSDFSLPPSHSTPIIMIGPGTGIAPYRSFWQERLVSKDELGEARLFFGCRSNHEFLYHQEIAQAKAKGALSHVHVAFSRAGPAKDYVQHHIKQAMDQIWELLTQKSAIVYVCGDVGMSKDVEDAFKEILQMKGMSMVESTQFIADLIKNKRYLVDVFGTTLHVKKQISEQKALAMCRVFKKSPSQTSLSVQGSKTPVLYKLPSPTALPPHPLLIL